MLYCVLGVTVVFIGFNPRRTFVRKERCVRIRSGLVRAALRPASSRPKSTKCGAESGGLGKAISGWSKEAIQNDGSQARRPVSFKRSSSSSSAHLQMPCNWTEKPAFHEGSRRGPRGDRSLERTDEGIKGSPSSAQASPPRPGFNWQHSAAAWAEEMKAWTLIRVQEDGLISQLPSC